MSSSTGTRHIGGGNPSPIKSSLSVILEQGHIWSNYSSDSCTTSRMFCQSGPNVGCKGDVKEWTNKFTDMGAIRNMEKDTMETFAKCLVQRHKKKRLLAKKTLSRTGKSDRRTKKTRQVFTFSRPANFQQPGFFTAHRPYNEGIEIYESSGGSVCYKDAEGVPQKAREQPITFVTPAKGRPHRPEVPEVVPLPRVLAVPQNNGRVDPCASKSSCDNQIFFPDRLLIPPQRLPGTCFPRAKSQPDLYYTISNQSMPLKYYTSAHSFEEAVRKKSDVHNCQDDMNNVTSNAGMHQKNHNPPVFPMNGIKPSCQIFNDKPSSCHRSGLSPQKSPTHFNERRDIMRGCQELNEFLSKKMAQTLTDISNLHTRGRLMDYAKFGSSFKISEDVYEDINRRSLSGMPKMADSMAPISFRGPDLLDKTLGYIHKVNPDFDDNQSLTEALTANRSPYQSSSMTSVGLRSELLTKVYHRFSKSVKVETSGAEETFSWIRTPDAITSNEAPLRMRKKQLEVESIASSAGLQVDHQPRFVDFSNENIPCVPRSKFVTGMRQQRLTELKISLLNGRYQFQKETDLWSSTNKSQTSIPVRSDPMEMACGDQASRRKLCDGISQTGIFNNSSVELFKRPFWRFKLDGSVVDVKRAKLAQDFVSKAHHYMCGKDYHRMMLNRCFFRTSPAVRLTDQSTQFPDSNCKIDDRLVEIERTVDDEYLTLEAATYVHENYTAVPEHCKHSIDDSLSAFHCRTFETNANVPYPSNDGCRKHVSRMSFTEFNCLTCPTGNSTMYCSESKKLVEETPGVVHSETVYENLVPVQQEQTSLMNFEGVDLKPKPGTVSHSFRALCDKRRIHIKYKNGKYTVYKEVDRTRRQTVWSLLTGKATNLLSSVIPKKPSPHRSFRSHKSRVRTVGRTAPRKISFDSENSNLEDGLFF